MWVHGGEGVLPQVVRASGFLAGIYTGGPGSSQPWRSTLSRATAGPTLATKKDGLWPVTALGGEDRGGRWLGRAQDQGAH